MKIERRFLDSNVILYLVENDLRKAAVAEELVSDGATVSVQVLNEFVSVGRKKLALDWDSIWNTLNAVRKKCEVVPVTLAMHDLAMQIAAKNDINICDALIVAAAQLSDCTVLVTEDLNEGQRFGGLVVHNPFR